MNLFGFEIVKSVSYQRLKRAEEAIELAEKGDLTKLAELLNVSAEMNLTNVEARHSAAKQRANLADSKVTSTEDELDDAKKALGAIRSLLDE